MEPTPAPKPFWQSKAFWVAAITLVTNLLAFLSMVGLEVPAPVQGQILAGLNSLLAFLGIIFRWTATEPLSLTNQDPFRR